MPDWVGAVAIWVGLAAAAWLLHRLRLWLEAKGWLYCRKGGGGGLTAGFLEVQKLLEPQVRHVIRASDERRKDRHRSDSPTALREVDET